MSKTYNWGILAPGSIAHKFASDLKLLPNANLYAVGSRSLARAKNFATQYGAKKAFGSYEELAADPKVDIIYIASPHMRHYSDTLLCLRNRKAVLCEKPVAMNAQQCRVMIDTARKNRIFFMEALWTRFIPSFLKCKELVKNGDIGEIRVIESDFCFRAPYDVESRLFNPQLGGGSLLDIGIYPVFLALEIAGNPLKIKAMAVIGGSKVDHSCSMLFEHQGSILSVLYCSFVNNARTESLIQGSEGIIRINSPWHTPTSLDLIPDGKEPIHFDFDEPGYGYQYEAAEVMKCLDKGKRESPCFGWQRSIDLITTLDRIRREVSIVYPPEIEKI